MDEQTLLPYKTDIAILILFFNRPECLEKVFEAVREARPSRLFLYQDGPRGGAGYARCYGLPQGC